GFEERFWRQTVEAGRGDELDDGSGYAARRRLLPGVRLVPRSSVRGCRSCWPDEGGGGRAARGETEELLAGQSDGLPLAGSANATKPCGNSGRLIRFGPTPGSEAVTSRYCRPSCSYIAGIPRLAAPRA